ncbi:MAG TPA: hypothetical protein VKY74_04130 [Chloroflexia bacterium]|nr:hypothetical protein [Chloroflexia bacterium]
MITPLDPQHLTPAASLNRLRIGDLPGLALDPAARGQCAYDLLSTAALVALVRQHAAALGLTPADLAAQISCGAYAQLHTLTDNLGAWLAQQISRRIGRAVAVELVHDGTAAARAYAGAPRTAVIMLGTALGVGFAPEAPLGPVAPDLDVSGG